MFSGHKKDREYVTKLFNGIKLQNHSKNKSFFLQRNLHQKNQLTILNSRQITFPYIVKGGHLKLNEL